MKITSVGEMPRVDTMPQEAQVPALAKFLTFFTKDVVSAINGNLTFADNFKASLVGVTFSSTNTNTMVVHTLGRVPVGYIPVSFLAAANVYTGTTASTTTTLTLKSDVATAVTFLVF